MPWYGWLPVALAAWLLAGAALAPVIGRRLARINREETR